MVDATKRYKISGALINSILILFSICCVIPIVAIVSISLTSEQNIMENGYSLIPRALDLGGYAYILYNPIQILSAYKISIIVSLVGTVLSTMVISGIAYPLSRVDFKQRKALNFYVYFTMLFNGGMVTSYILVSNYLHLKDTIFALILPYVVNSWYVIILRTFMSKIPMDIIESCKIDGANEFSIFFRFILPLSKPGLATVSLFILLQYWNDWWLGILYIDSYKMVPLQLMLYRMMSNIEFLTSSTNMMPPGMKTATLPKESARMAMAILAAGPILFVFPFFQKYFVKGLTVGSVKG